MKIKDIFGNVKKHGNYPKKEVWQCHCPKKTWKLSEKGSMAMSLPYILK